jgi:sec-independent protein translocase protein TatA
MHIPGIDQWFVIALLGLLLFGKRLPEVGRSIGKGIVEFKKGLAGIEEDFQQAGTAGTQPVRSIQPQQYKFDPQTGQPLQPQIVNAVPPGAKFDPYTGKPLDTSSVTTGSESQTSSV